MELGDEKRALVGAVSADTNFSAKALNECFAKNFDKLNCLQSDYVITNDEFDAGLNLLSLDDQVKLACVRKHSGIIKELGTNEMLGETGVSLKDMAILDEMASSGKSWPAVAYVRNQERHQEHLGGLGAVAGMGAALAGALAGPYLLDKYLPGALKPIVGKAFAAAGISGLGILAADALGCKQAKQVTSNIFNFCFAKPMDVIGHFGWDMGEEHAKNTFTEHISKLNPLMSELDETKAYKY
jgi:hypothetical protein